MAEAFLIFYLWNARRKARTVATAEALCLLCDLHAVAPPGGPLSEQGGLFWITLSTDSLEQAMERLPRLGYTRAVDLLEKVPEHQLRSSSRMASQEGVVRWRRRYYKLVNVYKGDAQAIRESAPDRRVFMLETAGGDVRPIRGYRGDGKALSRRGLPVYDARMLVNLVTGVTGAVFLDPFAGVGGIILEAIVSGYCVVSSDRDPILRYGLSHLGAHHCVADACRLPFGTATIDCIASEPPYDRQAENTVINSLGEMHRVLKENGRVAILCATWQAEGLRQKGASLELVAYVDSPINRKGTDCTVLAWQKAQRN